MFCKNCGKEIKVTSAFCPECGANTGEASTSNISTNAINHEEITKKKSPSKLIVAAIIVVVILIIGILGSSDEDSESLTVKSDNYNGMSFNYDVSEWCTRFNKAINEVDEEFETDTNIKLKSSSFKLDSTDYDTTDANVVRYYYSGNFKKDDDFAISLYVDSDTDKVCKCEINYVQYSGDDLSLLVYYSILPCIMATTDTDFDSARSILNDKVLKSNNYTYYNNNICYQYGATSQLDCVAIQAVSQEVYDEKY